jgi:hypothetical protein
MMGIAVNTYFCGCSSMVELELPKLQTWVRFPSPAPYSNDYHKIKSTSGNALKVKRNYVMEQYAD